MEVGKSGDGRQNASRLYAGSRTVETPQTSPSLHPLRVSSCADILVFAPWDAHGLLRLEQW